MLSSSQAMAEPRKPLDILDRFAGADNVPC
jgi:hypothetical protein